MDNWSQKEEKDNGSHQVMWMVDNKIIGGDTHNPDGMEDGSYEEARTHEQETESWRALQDRDGQPQTTILREKSDLERNSYLEHPTSGNEGDKVCVSDQKEIEDMD